MGTLYPIFTMEWNGVQRLVPTIDRCRNVNIVQTVYWRNAIHPCNFKLYDIRTLQVKFYKTEKCFGNIAKKNNSISLNFIRYFITYILYVYTNLSPVSIRLLRKPNISNKSKIFTPEPTRKITKHKIFITICAISKSNYYSISNMKIITGRETRFFI